MEGPILRLAFPIAHHLLPIAFCLDNPVHCPFMPDDIDLPLLILPKGRNL